MIDLLKRINESKKSNYWTLGNSVLYKLCKDHPYHKTDEEIAAKIWLIGRSYAASIERRIKYLNPMNDVFYSEIVIPKLKKGGIDDWIQECRNKKTTEVCLLAHKKTINLFKDISGLEKRSLASKYLHFHLPDLFFLYDSRASKSINVLLKEMNIKNTKIEVDGKLSDKDYALFFKKCLKAQTEIKKQHKTQLNCRQLDTLLINIANNRLRK